MRSKAAPPDDLQLLEMLRSFCAYQERCHSEVKAKMERLKIPYYKQDDFIAALIRENFLNEERFARLYAVSKLRQKHWGKRRIAQALFEKRLSDYCQNIALKSIDQDEYQEILQQTAEKKAASILEADPWIRKNKLADYLIRKGFEAELVWPVVTTLVQAD
jgi:regulatory protein